MSNPPPKATAWQEGQNKVVTDCYGKFINCCTKQQSELQLAEPTSKNAENNFDQVLEAYKQLPTIGLAYDKEESVRILHAFMKTVKEMGVSGSSNAQHLDGTVSRSSSTDSDSSTSDSDSSGGASDSS